MHWDTRRPHRLLHPHLLRPHELGSRKRIARWFEGKAEEKSGVCRLQWSARTRKRIENRGRECWGCRAFDVDTVGAQAGMPVATRGQCDVRDGLSRLMKRR